MTLNELANKYGSDKGDAHHEAHSYADIYEKLLSEFDPEKLRLLEIGVYDHRFPGASPRMWREFLPKAQLFGIDINPAALTLERETGMKIFLANQGEPTSQQVAMSQIGQVDVVVDDGSHFLNHISLSLQIIWPYVAPGGYYIVEDLHAPHAQPRHYLDKLVNDEFIGFAHEVAQQRWERDEKLFILKKA